MSAKKWKQSRDPLYRGDHKDTVSVPSPGANDSVVRHVLYLEGTGRDTPYLSTSGREEVAQRFAQAGSVWKATVAQAKANNVGHISNSELLDLMTGNGKGKAKWPDAYEVMQARRFVEQDSEHLLDFRGVADAKAAVKATFSKS